MRVAMIGQYPEPGGAITGGVERVIATLMPKLAERAEVCLFAPGSNIDREVNDGPFPIVYTRRAPGPGILRYWSVDAHRLRAPIRRFKPDIIHIQGMAGFHPGLEIPSILTLHGIVDRDLITSNRGRRWGTTAQYLGAQWLRFIEDRARNRIGNIIVINPYVCEELPDIAHNSLFDIPNPIAPAYCEGAFEKNAETREHRILSVGRIGSRKNTLEAVRIASLVLHKLPEARYIVCGSADHPDYLAMCEEAARQKGVLNRVEFRGNLGIEELIAEMDRASCLLMTSLQETAPLAISECNARGVPAVAPKNFGIKHMIEEGQNGFFLSEPQLGLEARAAVLERTLKYPWNRLDIARATRKIYSLAEVANATIEAYKAVLHRTVEEPQYHVCSEIQS